MLGDFSLHGGEGSILGVVLGTILLQVLQNLVNLLCIPSSQNFAVMNSVILPCVLADQQFARYRKRRRLRGSQVRAAQGHAAELEHGRVARGFGPGVKSRKETSAMSRFARYPSLEDRAVLVTGGATGIGATLVEEFVAQGAHVGFIDIDAAPARALVARMVAGARHAPVFAEADLTDVDALNRAIDHLRTQIGPIVVLLNNAANDQRHSISATTSASWDAGIAINLKQQFFAAQNVAEDMKSAGGGSIVNFSSISWKLKQGGMPVYTTAKAAVQGLTRSLARDFGPFNIRVNTLLPGWVMTEKQIRLWVDGRAREDIARGQCINQPLQPEHIARMALYLAADDSAMCTAQDFIVDGGWA